MPEIEIFIVLATLIVLVFIVGIIVFVFQYHKRKLLHEREKAALNEQHIQELLTTKLEIQQHTMQDIGREIHDNVGQRLTLASLYAKRFEHGQITAQQLQSIAEIGKIIDESLAELRSLSRNLVETMTDTADLVQMVQNECKRVNELDACVITHEFVGWHVGISTTLRNFILRIIQEFVQNSLKHAQCKNIILKIDSGEEMLKISIHDDGRGFSMAGNAGSGRKGIGLQNMKKRAELIGAGFTLESVPGKGTSLHLSVPSGKLGVS